MATYVLRSQAVSYTHLDVYKRQALVFSFSNDIMDVGTEIVVTDEAGKNVASGEPEVTGPNVRQPLDAPLAAGSYQATWRVVSSDGHPIEGNFGITLSLIHI